MGAGAEAGILLHVPVFQVVAGGKARLGKVGYLVLLIAVLRQNRDGVEIHIRLGIVVREALAVPAVIQGRAGFQLQAVAGDMLRGQGDDGGEGVLPLLHGLARQAVDQVHTEVFEPGLPHGGHGLLHLGKGMDAADGAKQAVIRRLNAQRYPVEARPTQRTQGLDVTGGVRVGLQRDLGVAGHRAALAEGPQQLCQAVRSQIAGGTAAEVHRVHPMGSSAGRDLLDMAQQGGGIGVHLLLAAGQRVKVAVGAFLAAEGDVDIEPERGFFFLHISVPEAAVWSQRRKSS